MSAGRLVLWISVAVVALAPVRAFAGVVLSPEQQAETLLRVLAYEYTLPERAGESVDWCILLNPRDPKSMESGRRFEAALNAHKDHQIQDLPMRVRVLEWTDGVEVAKVLQDGEIDVLYVAEGLYRDLEIISKLAREARVLTVTGTEQYVRAGLVTVAGVREGSTARLLVGQNAAREEHVSFSANLLRIAEVIRAGN